MSDILISIHGNLLGLDASNNLIINGSAAAYGVNFGNGTVSAPSIAFASDTNTGLYRIGTDNLGVACNGAKVLDIATTGLTITGALTATSGTISGVTSADIKKCSAQTDSITTVLANVTGLTAQTLVAGATYRFRCVLPGTADGTSGIKYAFKYTTATLTSIESTGKGYTASAVAVQHTTTTTDATLLFDQGAAVILVELAGTLVVNAGGTVALQIGTHTGTTTCSCYLGATMEFTRIA